MAIHWQIPFKSLRSETLYTVNIYDSSYSGSPVVLKGGAEPFTTEEDADEDMFAPIRTQSGTICIVDDGKDASGNTLSSSDDWRAMLPATDTDRPVTLTHVSGSSTIIDWQGFMQAQNFGTILYGDPQEREFPVQCCLSILNATEVSTIENALNNFAYLLKTILVTNMPTLTFSSFIIQGGNDARRWLLKKFDWNNFLTETDESDGEPRYSYYDVLQDMCMFWGWTARTHKNILYLTCMDDSAEQTILTLTPTELGQLASESSTSAGSVSNVAASTVFSGDIFASVNNDSYQNRGPHKATVKADVNANDRVIKVFPPSVEKELDEGGWHWVQTQGEDMVGYFETGMIYSFDTAKLKGYQYGTSGAFSMRQIYSTKDSDQPTEADMILVNHIYDDTPAVSIETKKAMAFAGGSLVLSGTVYMGSKQCDWEPRARLYLRLGIGMTRATARWWYMESPILQSTISSGWTSPGTVRSFAAGVVGGTIMPTSLVLNTLPFTMINYNAIPVPNNPDFYGFIYIDILGLKDDEATAQSFQIADFSVEFKRDSIEIPTSINQVRSRELKEERITTKEYTSNNQNSTSTQWNADCIFATDNNMKYGYGLLMEPDGTFLEKCLYNNVNEHPEQHLANRVTAYWTRSRRSMKVELRSNAIIMEPTPIKKITIDGTTGQPVAISHKWRDDVTIVTLMELP